MTKEIPSKESSSKEYQRQSERSGKALRQLQFSVLKKEGTFRFDDLPAGDYALVISLTDNCGMDFGAGDWYLQSSFTVDGQSDTLPIDLGKLSFVRTLP